MTLSKKFIISLLLSIIFIAFINIISFYIFYSLYLKSYFTEKTKLNDKITIEYINDAIKNQTIDDINSIFTDTEIEFFELLENNNGKIPIGEQKNIDIVINYLIKSGVTPKYIEKIIPTNNFGKILEALENKNSLEYKFVNKIAVSILIINILSIGIIIFILLIFIKKIIIPIKNITENIEKSISKKNISGDNNLKFLEYHNKKDEIGILITTINKLNSKINLQEKIKSRLLADISHELKTPITSIQCYLEGINDGVIKLNTRNLNSITNEMERLISLVNKIMDYENNDRKKIKLKQELINIVDLIKNITETHKKRIKENKQRIKISGENIFINLDGNLFKQICHNIIGNFLKYAGKNSLLKINITKKYIDFSDNGVGVNSSEIPFLTEKFYQGSIEKTGDINSRGIGIGLNIINKIIINHGWNYRIKSEKGKGFSFKIFF